jgi:hypothetical protein
MVHPLPAFRSCVIAVRHGFSLVPHVGGDDGALFAATTAFSEAAGTPLFHCHFLSATLIDRHLANWDFSDNPRQPF